MQDSCLSCTKFMTGRVLPPYNHVILVPMCVDVAYLGQSIPETCPYLEAGCLQCSQAACFAVLLRVSGCKAQCTLEELSVLCMCNDAGGASTLCNKAPAMRLAANDMRMMRTTKNSAQQLAMLLQLSLAL